MTSGSAHQVSGRRLRVKQHHAKKVTPQMTSGSAHKAHRRHKRQLRSQQHGEKKISPQMTASGVVKMNHTGFQFANIARMKAEIMSGAEFREESEKLSKLLCGAERQTVAASCAGSVDEALFCFAFAKDL